MNSTDITPRYYIYVYYLGSIGNRNGQIIKEQPTDGFNTELEAEDHLKELILAKTGQYFDRDWYKFTILKTWNSLSAV